MHKTGKYYHLRKFEGVCARCGKCPPRLGSFCCEPCRVSNNDKMFIRKERDKAEVFNHYGWKCACCGETETEFLSLDHVNNDGAEHRKTVPANQQYRWVIKNNYPNTIQLLCRNCNWGKHVNGGICPHQSPSSLTDV